MNSVLKVIEPILLAAVPAVLLLCALYGVQATALLSFATVLAALIPFFLRFERQRPRPRDLMPIVVLSAIAAVGRILFAALPNFKPVSAIVIVSAVCFGRQSGFLTGALAALSSNMFFGQGAWTPWQMYAWGLIGYLAGALNEHGCFRRRIVVYVFGFLSALIYGLVMDSWHIVGFIRPLSWQTALVAYGTGFPFNLSHGVATVVFLLLTLSPWCRILQRIKTKYGVLSPGGDSASPKA